MTLKLISIQFNNERLQHLPLTPSESAGSGIQDPRFLWYNTSMLSRALRLFLGWYFLREPKRIVIGYVRYAHALLEIVPFPFLIMTLFSPWKNILDRAPRRGFSLQRILEVLALSFLARGTGCVVRLLTMALGICAHVLLLAVATLYLLLWIFSAPLTLVGIAVILHLL